MKYSVVLESFMFRQMKSKNESIEVKLFPGEELPHLLFKIEKAIEKAYLFHHDIHQITTVIIIYVIYRFFKS